MKKVPNQNSLLWKYQNPIIVYYHLVSDKVHPYYPNGSINPNDFREQIKNLKKNFTIISLPEAFERDSTKNRITNSLVLTIDDGFAECYSVIAPILNDENIPATFFLIENCIDNKKMMWLHQLQYLQQTLSKQKINNIIQAFTNQTIHELKSYSSLPKMAKEWNMNEKDDFTKILWNLSDKGPISEWLQQNQPYLNKQRILELISAGFTIGSHSATHPSCDLLNYNELEDEIIGSCEKLSTNLELEIKYFSYPFGRRANLDFEKRILAKSNIQCLIGGKPRLFRKNTFPYWEAYNFERNSSTLLYQLLVNSFSC